ncbi:MAG: hypothetical protein KJ872_09750 [Alphaproteobacteria bacterium]|nr:hypothetical protein [Alphaproteobacteria bacterium]
MSTGPLSIELHHLFPTQIKNAEAGDPLIAKQFLGSIGFDIEWQGNKRGLFVDQELLGKLRSASPEIRAAFKAAGFAENQHGGSHPNYNDFIIGELANFSAQANAGTTPWSPEAKQAAAYDLLRFVDDFVASGSLSVKGTSLADFQTSWANWRGTRDYTNLLPGDAVDIASFANGLDKTSTPPVIGEGQEVARKNLASQLYNKVSGSNGTLALLNMDELLRPELAIINGNKATSIITPLIYSLIGKGLTGTKGAAAFTQNFADDQTGGVVFDPDEIKVRLESVLGILGDAADLLPERLSDLGDGVLQAAGKSIGPMIVGAGGSIIGDAVEFLNLAYEPMKKGLRTGDWSDFYDVTIEYGTAAAVSAVLVGGAVAVAGAFAGPVAAAFVGAGFAAYGLYDAITNGVELFGQITADLAGVIEKVEVSIINFALSLDEGLSQLARAVGYIFGVDPEHPLFNVVGETLVTKYLVDPLEAELPGRVDGTDKREWFFGKNNAVINAGGGNDELYVADATVARGDAGNDVVIGRDSRIIRAGQAIDPTNPESPLANTDLVMQLDGGDGDDWIILIGGDGGVLRGGAGSDILIGGGAESHLYGGEGSDLFHIGANSILHDAELSGESVWMGLPIFGGTKQWWMEGNKAYWSPFSTIMTAFPVIGSEILATASFFVDVATMKFASFQSYEDGGMGINIGYGLGGVAKIEDYQLDLDSGKASGGVVVFSASRAGDASSGFERPSQEKFTQFLNLALKAGFGVGFSGWDPIVLDLDGDGYELTTQRNSGIHFEFDGDGFAEKTGWVRPDDGFLVLDANANGVVDDATEFFGDETQGGFVELATYDLNLDGVIDSLDAVFGDLRVWRDLNSDGVTDAGELVSLSDLGISSISLAAVAPAEELNIGGNVVAFESTFTLTDGTVRKAGDVVLDISHIDTRYITDTAVSVEASALPKLRGFGNVADLHVAMSENASLLAQVAAFDALATSDLAALKHAAEEILYAWAGVDGVSADPIGTEGFDARKLAFLEAFGGQEIAPRDPVTGAVSTAGLAELEASWDYTLESLTLRLVVQSSSLPAFADMTYREDLDLIVMGSAGTLKQAYSAILAGLSSDPATALGEWEAWGELLRAVQDGSRRFDNNIVRDDFAAAQLLAAIAESGTNLDLAALAPALGITNLRIGAAGGENLSNVSGGTIFSGLGDGDIARGRTGQDVYLLESGFGNVVIDDEEGVQTGDRIRFVDLNRADVSAARVGDDLILTVTANGNTVTVLGQFADVVPLSSDVFASNNRGIEEIQFADGTVMELPDIAIAVGEGTAGDDVLEGTMHTDVFQGRAGNDTLMGGDDADLYVFDAGDGADIIRDQQSNPLLKAADMLIFGDDIAPEDLIWSRGSDPDDLVITIGSSGDSITVEEQFSYSSLGYNGQFALNSRIELFSFRHFGDVYTHKDIQQQMIAAETTGADDITLGFGDDDTFGASAGNDTLVGLDGNDTYSFGRGVGNDTIDEQAIYIDVDVGLGGLRLEMGADTVVFAPDVDPEDVVFTRLSEAPDLTVTLDSGETLTVRNQFDGFQTGPLGSQWFDRIEWFEFGNGTRLSWQDVLLDVTTGAEGDDSLWGDLFEDTLAGGLGNDYLSGGGYADTYIFNSGDGQDTVDDDNTFILGSGFVSVDTAPDILRLGEGISSADVSLERVGQSLKLNIGINGDSVLLQGQNDYYHTGVFGAISNGRIERVEFADGEVWTWQDLNARAIADQTTTGDDTIDGFALEDRFEASAGNDIMRGGDSGDTYLFGIGSGEDRIEETVNNQNFDDDDRVEFTPGITQSDVTFERDADNLIIRINGTADQLTIAGQFDNYVGFTDHDVETFHFADGSVVTKAEIQTQLTTGTSGNDVVRGFHTNDTLIGGAGTDSLYGADGSDTYLFNLGDGQDTIFEDVEYANLDDDDRLKFGAGILPSDVILSRSGDALTLSVSGTTDAVTVAGQFAFTSWYSWNDVEFFEFADGTVWTKRDVSNFLSGGTSGDDVLVGTFQSDELNGLAGNDILRGGDGSDIYYFGIGYGQDTIEETVTNANLANFDQIVMNQGVLATDLTFTRNGDALTIGIAGTTDTITVARQFDNYIGRTDYDIEQLQFADGSIMTKEEIQAVLTVGTPADEEVLGFHTNDVLDGAAGNDILRGLDGSDTYLFGRGSGNDIVRESVQYVNLDDDDRVLFASDIAPEDIIWSRNANSLIIGIADTNDTLTVENGFAREGSTGYTWRDVERFEFADGTVLSKSDVQAIVLQPTDGNDTIDGFWTSDILAGGPGDDLLRGGEGNDTYIYNLGDGDDTIAEWVAYYGSFDTLQFGAGIVADDLRFAVSGENYIVTFDGSAGSITLNSQRTGGRAGGVEGGVNEFRFTDGTVWNRAQIDAAYLASQTTGGDDLILGTNRNDVIDGGAGNDTLRGGLYSDRLIGGAGNDLLEGNDQNDTYVYNLGDGDDTIAEWQAYYGSFDILEFGAGIAAEDLRFAVSGEHYVVTFDGSPGSITLNWQRTGGRSGGREGGVNEFRFTDGTVWNRAQIDAAYLADQTTGGDDLILGTNRSDVIEGGAGNDTLKGGLYNDRLIGGAGNDVLEGSDDDDTYVYNLGDGDDTIAEWQAYYGSFDILEFGAGIAAEDLRFAVSGEHYVVTFDGSPGSITLNWQRTGGRSGGREGGVNEFRFADGTVWNRALIDAAYLADQTTDGDDSILGTIRNDVITGGLGNDTLNGSSGTDVATYAGLSTEYSMLTGGGTFQIRDDVTVTGADEGTDTLISVETLQFGDGQTVGITSPIILDLDGNGIATVSAADSDAQFDLDGDGLADDTSWISAGDAFLFLDRDSDGTMSGVDEISFVDDVPNAATDLAGLRAFDSNGDSILDATDTRFADFGVWRDADSDGSVDEGEIASLADVGIRSINLAGTPNDAVTEFGEVAIANTGIFTLVNGSTRTFADAALTYFSAATNLPSLAATHYDFDRQASKYRIGAARGALTVTPRRARSGIDPLAGQLEANTVLTFSNGTFGMFAPVVLDLDGDGIELVSRKKSRASFDYAGDGATDDTGWIGRDDGFLVIDRNNDGLITEAAELSLASEDREARSGLQGLTRLDGNGDGVVNNDDARFGELRVWQDRNGNGRTDAGELLSLEEAGIVAIRLSTLTPTQDSVKLDRNIIAATTTFVRANGTTSTAADVSLAYRPATASAAATTSLASKFDLLGPDLFLAQRRDGNFGRAAFQRSMGELFEMFGAASPQRITDLFDRVVAEDKTASALRQSALTVTANLERQPMPLQRVFDPASTYFMRFQPFQQQLGSELVVKLLDVDPVAIAPAFAGIALDAAQGPDAPAIGFADNSSPVEIAGTGTAASSAAQEQTQTEPVVQPTIERPRLDPAENMVWGGPARIGGLPDAPGGSVKVSTPPSHMLQPRVDLAELLAHPSANDTAPDVEIARKLAMIRQDLSSFGAIGTGEIDRLRQQEPESFYLYA